MVFTRSFLPVLLLSALSLLSSVLAQGRTGTTRGQIYFGCYATRPQNTADVPIRAVANANSFSQCLSNCLAVDTTNAFGYWQQNTTSCNCGAGVQLPNTLQTSNFPCPAGSFTYGRTSTTFQQYGSTPCRTTTEIGISTTNGYTQVQGPRSCARQCASFRYAYLWMDVTANQFKCACSNTERGGATSSTVCAQNNAFVFEHSPQAQASTLDRKKKRDAAEAKRRELPLFCPKGLTACGIEGIDGAFECLDPLSELESCGGCLFPGPIDPAHPIMNVTAGIDCSTGAAMGAATCINGRCKVAACSRGWQLREGVCVRAVAATRHRQTVVSW